MEERSPPTGPISPAAKKPAAGAPAARRRRAASWSGRRTCRARGRCTRTPARRPARGRRAPQAQRRARPAGRGRPTAASRACSRTTWPGCDDGADGDRAGVRIGADQAAHEEVALHVVGLVRLDDDARAAVRSASSTRSLGGERPTTSCSFVERRAAGELVDDVPLGGGDRQLGPKGAAPCETQRQQLDPVEAQADRAAGRDLVVVEQRGAAAAGARGRRRRSAERRREPASDGVGRERGAGRQQQDRAVAPARSGRPMTSAPSEPSTTGRGTRSPRPPQRRRPYGDAVPCSSSRPSPSTPWAPQPDQLRGRERVADDLDVRLGLQQVQLRRRRRRRRRTRRRRQASRARPLRRLDRPGTRIGVGRQAASNTIS